MARREKPTLTMAQSALISTQAGVQLAQRVIALGGTIAVTDDGEVTIRVADEHDDAAKRAIVEFEGA